jgi:diguanylate cyclase (GGDEF)-like protein
MSKIYLDELTGSYNRRYLYYWINNEIKRANRYTMKFALILLDVDNFRDINNNFGHLEGDRVLIEFTEFLHRNIREVDHIVRDGGDEFIVLVPNAVIQGINLLAQRLLTLLNETEIANHKIHCSIGFSLYPQDGETVEELFNQADNLMYQAKKEGKNRIGLPQKIIRKLRIPSPITIGRKDETTWCLNQLQEYNTILVAGEIGVGKTRLALEVRDNLNTGIFLRGNANAALSAVPYHPFKHMFRGLVDKHFAMVQRVFKQIPDSYKAEVMKLMPAEVDFHVVQTPGMDKYRLYNAVSEFIQQIAHLASPSATTLLLDDLHWMDRPSCELFDFLIRSVKNNIKIFGTYRVEEVKSSEFSEFLGLWAREKLYSQISVRPLNIRESSLLLKAIIGSVPQSAAKFIYHESGGNPFFIEEILRELEHQSKLYLSGRKWVFAKHLEVTIPSSIEETIKRKLKFIGPEIKQFLEIAAVFGQEFAVDAIAVASKRNVGEVLHAFDELNRLGIIKERSDDENFYFSEDIVRQVVYKNISRANIRVNHQLVGETIERFYRSSLPNYYEQLAQHFSIANDATRALYYSKKAAFKAKENYAYSLAITFFENALKYEEDREEIFNMRYALADIYFWTGDYIKATEELNKCLKVKPTAYMAYKQLGRIHANMGDYKNSLTYYRRGLKLAKGTDDVYLFRISIARVYWRRTQFLRAKIECEGILRDVEKMKKADIGFVYLTYGVVLLRLEQLDKAEVYLKKSLKINREIDDKDHVAACYQDLALCYLSKFNIKASEDYLKKALDIDYKIGYLGGIVIARINLGALSVDFNLPKAEQYYADALSVAKLIGAQRHIALLYNNLGHVYKNRLMDNEALQNFKRALKLAKEIHYDEIVTSANLSLSSFYREAGKTKKGKQYFQSAQKLAEKLNLKPSIISCMMEELHYLLDSQNIKRIISLSKKLKSALKHERDPTFRMYGLIYQARVMVKLKKYAQAHAYYKRAYNYIKSLPDNTIAGEIYYLKGIACKREKKIEEACKALQRAKQIFESVGNLQYVDKAQKALTDIGTT